MFKCRGTHEIRYHKYVFFIFSSFCSSHHLPGTRFVDPACRGRPVSAARFDQSAKTRSPKRSIHGILSLVSFLISVSNFSNLAIKLTQQTTVARWLNNSTYLLFNKNRDGLGKHCGYKTGQISYQWNNCNKIFM